MWRVIAQKVVGVNVKSLDDAAGTELQNGPVVAGNAFPAAFPAIHPLAAIDVLVFNKNPAAGLDEVFHLGKKIIAAGQRLASEALGCKIGEVGESWWVHQGVLGLLM